MIRHVGITVSNLERSIDFYGAMGFKPVFQIERTNPPDSFIADITGYRDIYIKVAMLQRGTAMIELLQYVRPHAKLGLNSPETFIPGNVHFCLEGDAELLIALATPLHWIRGIGEIPDGPQAGAKTYYFRGPDGETIELFFLPASAKT